METTVTKNGKTPIPASIRVRYNLKEGDRLIWLDDGDGIRIAPIPQAPLEALRETGHGGECHLDRLLQFRREEVEALTTMSGMDLASEEIMAGAWRR